MMDIDSQMMDVMKYAKLNYPGLVLECQIRKKLEIYRLVLIIHYAEMEYSNQKITKNVMIIIHPLEMDVMGNAKYKTDGSALGYLR